MRILLTGATGQVGSALAETLPALGEVVKAGRHEMDLQKPQAIRECLRAVRPEVIVNAAAYTAVDRAESEAEVAMAVNRDALAVLGEGAAKLGALVAHFSTDYVFGGEKSTPYLEDDEPNPLNVYGRSKLEGERALTASSCRHLIFRTSWVYAATGKNFLVTMLRLAREGRPLRVVDDQRGAPTSSELLAIALSKVLPSVLKDESLAGLYHVTADGSTTWRGFAEAIFERAGVPAEVQAISSEEYKSVAHRPANSILDNTKLHQRFGFRPPHWQRGLERVMARLRERNLVHGREA